MHWSRTSDRRADVLLMPLSRMVARHAENVASSACAGWHRYDCTDYEHVECFNEEIRR